MTTIAAGSSVTGFVPYAQTITFTPGTGGRISFNGRNQDGSAITPREIYAETAIAMDAGATFSADAIGVDGSHTDIQSSVSGGGAVTVGSSRALTASDNGAVLEATATITLTVPIGLPAGFACVVIPSGTTSVASSGGALLNGATTTLTRAAASNAMFAIQARSSAVDSYVVSGS